VKIGRKIPDLVMQVQVLPRAMVNKPEIQRSFCFLLSLDQIKNLCYNVNVK